MSDRNLDQLAWDYLMASPREQGQLSQLLIEKGAPSVFPLLRAGLRTIQEFPPARTSDADSARTAWIYQIAVPMLESIHQIVKSIGQSGYDALCRALWDQNERLKMLSATILLQEPNLSSRSHKQIEEVFYETTSKELSKKAFGRDAFAIALSNTLARGGSAQHLKLLQEMAKEYTYTFEQVIETTRNTLLLYLLQ